jgi:peptidyl-prolyl cis-trans isomerase SurA
VTCLAVAALVALPVLSACNSSPGAAAVVGDQRITTGELQAEVNTSLRDPVVKSALSNPQYSKTLGGNQAGFTRQTLTRLISQKLVTALAAAHHVNVTQQEVSAQQASFVKQAGSLTALAQGAADQVGVSSSQLPALIRFTVLEQDLGKALTANLTATQAQLQAEYTKDIDQYDQLDIAQIAVSSNKEAQQILAKVRANPSSFAALAKKDSLDTQTKSKGGLVGLVGRSQVVQALGGKAASAKPGSFVVVPSSGEFVVLHIIKRQVQPLSQVVDKVKAALFASQAQTLLGKAVTTEAAKIGVHVSPRYGHWDNKSQSVVVSPNPVSSPG